jgi:hypothetical protein
MSSAYPTTATNRRWSSRTISGVGTYVVDPVAETVTFTSYAAAAAAASLSAVSSAVTAGGSGGSP